MLEELANGMCKWYMYITYIQYVRPHIEKKNTMCSFWEIRQESS